MELGYFAVIRDRSSATRFTRGFKKCPLCSLGDQPQFAAANAHPVPHELYDDKLASARMAERINSQERIVT
jgi:hypothetical protein